MHVTKYALRMSKEVCVCVGGKDNSCGNAATMYIWIYIWPNYSIAFLAKIWNDVKLIYILIHVYLIDYYMYYVNQCLKIVYLIIIIVNFLYFCLHISIFVSLVVVFTCCSIDIAKCLPVKRSNKIDELWVMSFRWHWVSL